MQEAKYLEEQRRQVASAGSTSTKERRGTKPRSNAQVIRKVNQDE